MKVTTVRFSGDLWRLLESEAAVAGVSVSQYLREAALARASAAAAARGEDPLELLGGGAPPRGRMGPVRRLAIPERNTAKVRRQAAAATLEEADAVLAAAEQTVRHSRELAAERGQPR